MVLYVFQPMYGVRASVAWMGGLLAVAADAALAEADTPPPSAAATAAHMIVATRNRLGATVETVVDAPLP
jgi:hypothetical protein